MELEPLVVTHSQLDLKSWLVKIKDPTETPTGNTCELHILIIFSKVAPQNIQYDRRVVRGNTFAALVIPVSKLHSILI